MMGGYETEIADAGIDDKRLSAMEGEFANVLKVMSREGNTLSPVIRSAWDSGNLRSMTKNSEARATDAHISITGHITRDELRRLLTETESVNIDVYRDFVLFVTTANDGSYIDSTGDTGRARYTYRVCEAGTQTCSNNARVTFRQ
jgi:hypothetical protein